ECREMACIGNQRHLLYGSGYLIEVSARRAHRSQHVVLSLKDKQRYFEPRARFPRVVSSELAQNAFERETHPQKERPYVAQPPPGRIPDRVLQKPHRLPVTTRIGPQVPAHHLRELV